MKDEGKYRNLFEELSRWEQHGIRMRIDGELASPLQIATAHMAKENPSYMRDYILDASGNVQELCFNKIQKLN